MRIPSAVVIGTASLLIMACESSGPAGTGRLTFQLAGPSGAAAAGPTFAAMISRDAVPMTTADGMRILSTSRMGDLPCRHCKRDARSKDVFRSPDHPHRSGDAGQIRVRNCTPVSLAGARAASCGIQCQDWR